MLDWALDWWQNLQQYSLWIMFVSALVSATVLPGNSEIVFISFATPLAWANGYTSLPMFQLLIVATLGNSLGSLTTYWLGRALPELKKSQNTPRFQWAKRQAERFGSLVLLFSWLPIIGDLLCAIAGWMRLNWITSFFFIIIGKFVRYLLLTFLGASWLN